MNGSHRHMDRCSVSSVIREMQPNNKIPLHSQQHSYNRKQLLRMKGNQECHALLKGMAWLMGKQFRSSSKSSTSNDHSTEQFYSWLYTKRKLKWKCWALLWGTLLMRLFEEIIGVPTWKSGWQHLLVAAQKERRKWKKEALLFACLSSLMLASSSILWLLYSFADIRTSFFRFQHRLKTRNSPRILQAFDTKMELMRQLPLTTEQPPESQPL